MFTLQAKLGVDPKLPITTEVVKSILAETNIDLNNLGGAGELTKLLKIHPNFKELDLGVSIASAYSIAEKYRLKDS